MEKEISELKHAIEQSLSSLQNLMQRKREATEQDGLLLRHPLAARRSSAARAMLPADNQPDGSSVPRPHRPLETERITAAGARRAADHSSAEINAAAVAADVHLPLRTTPSLSQPAATAKSSVKLPKYNGTTPLAPYLSQLQLAALHSGWSDGEAATHLALALEGKAVQVLLDLAPAEQRDLHYLTTALQRRFGQRCSTDFNREQLASRHRQEGESLGTLAADVQLYAQRGYPHFDAAAQEELALHAFLRGLSPERLRQHVRLVTPQSLTEALREAERAEVVLSTTRPVQQRASAPRPLVRMADYEEGEEAEEVRQAMPPQSQFRGGTPRSKKVPRSTQRCYRCDEPGHIARDCPAPAPKAKATGNDYGVAQ